MKRARRTTRPSLIVRCVVRRDASARSIPPRHRAGAAALRALLSLVALALGCAPRSGQPDRPSAASLSLELPALRRSGLPLVVIAKLAQSRFRYFRMLGEGFELRTCEAFADLATQLPTAPVQGDAHLEQFAVTAGTYGLEDFDRAGVGPAVVDLVRYAASLQVACDDVRWSCDGGAAIDRFLSAYRAALIAAPVSRPPAVVPRLRARAPFTRTAWLAWIDALMTPPSEAVERAARQSFSPFAAAMAERHPELTPGALDIVRLSELRIGFGSAREQKLLFRLRGATEAPQDDLVVEARPPLPAQPPSCISRDAHGTSLKWRFTSVLGRRMPELYGFAVRGDGEQLWLQSWDPGYVELSVRDVTNQTELEELAVDAAHQLAAPLWSNLPQALHSSQRHAQLVAFELTRARIVSLARALAAESNQGWARLRTELYNEGAVRRY
jgi:Uncharacterized protein conserved in bacteria (DUF2252)